MQRERAGLLALCLWKWIDAKYFGESGSFEERIELLGQEGREGIEGFVIRKLAEREKRTLHDWMRTSLRLCSQTGVVIRGSWLYITSSLQ